MDQAPSTLSLSSLNENNVHESPPLKLLSSTTGKIPAQSSPFKVYPSSCPTALQSKLPVKGILKLSNLNQGVNETSPQAQDTYRDKSSLASRGLELNTTLGVPLACASPGQDRTRAVSFAAYARYKRFP